MTHIKCRYLFIFFSGKSGSQPTTPMNILVVFSYIFVLNHLR